MNAVIPPFKSGDIMETLMRLDTCIRRIMKARCTSYGMISSKDGTSGIFPDAQDPETMDVFSGFQSRCRMIAQNPERSIAPDALEFFPQGIVAHFGPLCFGSDPECPVELAVRIEVALHRLCRSGSATPATGFKTDMDGQKAIIQATDPADALVRAMILSGHAGERPGIIPENFTTLARRHFGDIDCATAAEAKIRLSRIISPRLVAAE